jgi:hypothetical protein
LLSSATGKPMADKEPEAVKKVQMALRAAVGDSAPKGSAESASFSGRAPEAESQQG